MNQVKICPRFQAHLVVGIQFPIVAIHGFPIIITISQIIIGPRFLVHLGTNPKFPTTIAKIKVCVSNFFPTKICVCNLISNIIATNKILGYMCHRCQHQT